MARYARLLFKSGRRFATAANVNDAMDEQARARGRVRLERLDDLETQRVDNSIRGRLVSSALTDSRHPSPDQQARTELDFGLIRKDPSLSERAGQVFDRLLLDHEDGCNKRIAAELGVSQPRVTQIKREELAPALARIGYALGPAAA